jgi:hypothetical protein
MQSEHLRPPCGMQEIDNDAMFRGPRTYGTRRLYDVERIDLEATIFKSSAEKQRGVCTNFELFPKAQQSFNPRTVENLGQETMGSNLIPVTQSLKYYWTD